MTMPNRMRGKLVPPKNGSVKICPHCKKSYTEAKLVKRGNSIIKYCPNPNCNKIIEPEVSNTVKVVNDKLTQRGAKNEKKFSNAESNDSPRVSDQPVENPEEQQARNGHDANEIELEKPVQEVNDGLVQRKDKDEKDIPNTEAGYSPVSSVQHAENPEEEQVRKEREAFEQNCLINNCSQPVFNDQAQGEDQLGIKEEVSALAETLLLRSVVPPIAVGIMGGWGSGKSFVMYLISKYVEETRAKIVRKGWPGVGKDNDLEIPTYVGHIYQISFNAWTYAKSNLWASLMDTIFTCLNRQMQLERLFAYQELAESEELPAVDAVNSCLMRGGDIFKKIYRDDYQIDLDTNLTPEARTNLSSWSAKLLSHNLLWHVMRNQNERALVKIREDEKELEKDKATRDALERARQTENVSAVVLDDKIAEPAYFALLQETLLGFISDAINKTVNQELKKQGIDKDQLVNLEKEAEHLIKGSRGILNAFRQNRYYWFAGLSIAVLTFALPYVWTWLGQPVFSHVITRSIAVVTASIPLLPTFLARWRKIIDFESETKRAFEKGYEAQQSRYAEEIASENSSFEDKVRKLDEEINKGSLPACNVLIRIKENQIEQQRRKIGPSARYSSLMEFVQSRLDAATYENQLGLMHQVRQDIDELTYSLVSSSNKDVFPRGRPRVILYIDDLDRCPPSRVVEVLEAVQLLLNTKLFVVILGLDTRYITRALEKEYKEILKHEGDPSGLDYIEKIIQIPYRVRSIESENIQKYLKAQMDIEGEPTQDELAVQSDLSLGDITEEKLNFPRQSFSLSRKI